jgi:hypothetical protein
MFVSLAEMAVSKLAELPKIFLLREWATSCNPACLVVVDAALFMWVPCSAAENAMHDCILLQQNF